MSKWKPIETAPFGLTVIVANISLNGQVNWVSDGVARRLLLSGRLWHTVNGTHVPEPNYWMDLPEEKE